MESKFCEIKFTDADVINPEEFIPSGSFNPHNMRPWLLHDHGFVLCVVFATNERDALDEAVDNDKLDRFLINIERECDRQDYLTSDSSKAEESLDISVPEYVDKRDGTPYWWKKGMEPTFLGNASEPFDIESLTILPLPNPAFSWCAMFNASQESFNKACKALSDSM